MDIEKITIADIRNMTMAQFQMYIVLLAAAKFREIVGRQHGISLH